MSGSASLTHEQLLTLAIEHWRLSHTVGESGPAPVRHALRKIGAVLTELGVEATSLDGQEYDAGMRARVLEQEEGTKGKRRVIVETVSPLVTWKGEIVRDAEVIVGSG